MSRMGLNQLSQQEIEAVSDKQMPILANNIHGDIVQSELEEE